MKISIEFYIIFLNFNVNKHFLFFGINFPKRDTLVKKKKKKKKKGTSPLNPSYSNYSN